jgi:periplasmic divalent cation tolerance protein
MAAAPAYPADATDTVVVLTTLASEDEAVALVRTLLDRRLVACGTVLPGARSLYRWEDRLADEREAVVLLKTTRPRLDALEAAFAELHPYAVPELLALPVAAGLARYVAWIATEVEMPVADPEAARAATTEGGA